MTDRRFLQHLGLLALALCMVGNVALAQGTSVLLGTVVDASTRKPLADVVVTATFPSLQGEQTVLTDAAGQYRIPQLPPGVYTLPQAGVEPKPQEASPALEAAAKAEAKKERMRRLDWAGLLRRTFAVDVFT